MVYELSLRRVPCRLWCDDSGLFVFLLAALFGPSLFRHLLIRSPQGYILNVGIVRRQPQFPPPYPRRFWFVDVVNHS